MRVVNVDVFVRDKDGNPVTGLTKDDFELYEDGKPIAITNFYEYKEGKEVRERGGAGSGEAGSAALARGGLRVASGARGQRRARGPAPQPGGLRRPAEHHADQPQQALPLPAPVPQHQARPRRPRDAGDLQPVAQGGATVHHRFPVRRRRHLRAREAHRRPQHAELRPHRRAQGDRRGPRLPDVVRPRQDVRRERLQRPAVHARRPAAGDGPARRRPRPQGRALRERRPADASGRGPLLGDRRALPRRRRQRAAGSGVGASDCSNAIMESFHYDASRRLTDIANAASANRVTIYTVDAAGLRIGGLRSAEFGSIGLSTNIESIYTQEPPGHPDVPGRQDRRQVDRQHQQLPRRPVVDRRRLRQLLLARLPAQPRRHRAALSARGQGQEGSRARAQHQGRRTSARATATATSRSSRRWATPRSPRSPSASRATTTA